MGHYCYNSCSPPPLQDHGAIHSIATQTQTKKTNASLLAEHSTYPPENQNFRIALVHVERKAIVQHETKLTSIPDKITMHANNILGKAIGYGMRTLRCDRAPPGFPPTSCTLKGEMVADVDVVLLIRGKVNSSYTEIPIVSGHSGHTSPPQTRGN